MVGSSLAALTIGIAGPVGAQTVTGGTAVPDERADVAQKREPGRGDAPRHHRQDPADRPVRDQPNGNDPAGSADRDERLARDPFSTMGGRSPFCSRPLDQAQRESCRRAGALEHPYRIDHYGFDIHVDTGADNIPGNFFYLLQTLAALAWIGLLYLLKGCLLALEWAFSLDLLADTMGAVRLALARLHTGVLGKPWFLAAILFAGIWAMWRGFVQRRHTDAVAGLLATALLMVTALVLIARPAETIGQASSLANQAAIGMVSGATTGTLNRPEAGFGRATSRLFDQLVLRPWCALEFADVEFCLSNPRKTIPESELPDDKEIRDAWAAAPTVADLWLRFEPNGSGDGNDQRNRIYENWRDNDNDRLQALVRIQKQGGTAARIALLLLIAIGMLAAICLLAWLVFRLLGFGVLALLLVLLAPLMFLAPALGDSGRATFVGWAKRLLGCLVAKAIYAVFLAVVLVAAAALGQAYELGWLAAWALQVVFWWAVLLKRNDLLQFVTAPLPDNATSQARGGIGHTLQTVFYARALAGAGAGAALAAAAPLTRSAGAARAAKADRSEARVAATRSVAETALRRQGRDQAEQTHVAAAAVLARDRHAAQGLRPLETGLRRYDERAALADARGQERPEPTSAERVLLARREQLQAQRPDAASVAAARQQLRHAEINRARTGEPITAQDERAWIELRRKDHQQRLPLDHERNLRVAGIDPADFRAAPAPQQQRMRAQVTRALEQERARLAVAPEHPSVPPPPPREIRAAERTLDNNDLRQARQAEFAARRQERRTDRARRRTRAPRPRR